MRLRSGHKALAKHAARANRNHALNDVKALAQRVARRVEQRADALLLVVVQNRPAVAVGAQLRLEPDDQENADQPEQHRRRNQLPAQPGKKNHRQSRAQHQQRGAQIRLLHDQSDRHRQKPQRSDKIERAQLAFALLEPPGQHQRHGDFQDFARLNHDTDIEPAPGAFLGDAEKSHAN